MEWCTGSSLCIVFSKVAAHHGLLGDRVENAPEVSSMVFRRAVSLATLWFNLRKRSCNEMKD